MGRLDKDGDRLRITSENGECTLYVDLEHDPFSGRQTRGHLSHQRAVPVLPAIHLAALQELADGPPPLELIERDKVVVDAIAFAGPRGPRGGGDARHEGRQVGEQPPEQRRLAHPGRARDHDEFARPVFHPDVVPQPATP